MGHISIFVEGNPLVLKEDFSITIEESNPYFNDNTMFSYPVEIPVEGNRFLMRNMDNPFSAQKTTELEKKDMSIWIDGMPYKEGICHVDDGQKISGSLSLIMDSMEQSISDMIGDMTCRDVPLLDKIQIGEMLAPIDFTLLYDRELTARVKKFYTYSCYKDEDNKTFDGSFEPNPLGFSYPSEFEEIGNYHAAKRENNKPVVKKSFINTSLTYNPSPGEKQSLFVNVPVCYKHYKANSTSEVVTDEHTGPYYVLPADRPCSGICFFVLYLFKCLFAYLGMEYDESELLKVDGLKRLIFYTTHCKYTLERKNDDKDYDISSGNFDLINQWASSRAGDTSHAASLKHQGIKTKGGTVTSVSIGDKTFVQGMKIGDYVFRQVDYYYSRIIGTWKANIMRMYASPENFPEMNVTDAISSMFGSFGVKFLYDYSSKRVKARLIREVYRNTEKPVTLQCQVLSVEMETEKITGVRMKYSDEADREEQMENIINGTKDYNTDYDYVDYNKVNLKHQYAWIKGNISAADTTCYIDRKTGNAYRYKINGDADTQEEMKPVLFEVGGFHGVEWGDCSEENEDYVEEIISNFQPMIFNDINLSYSQSALALDAKDWVDGTPGKDFDWNKETESSSEIPDQQILCPFLDEDMQHENQEMKTESPFSDGLYNFSIIQTLTTDESYDPSSNDNSLSPLQNHDWGNAIAVMQASGNAPQKVVSSETDVFGNSSWYANSGFFTISSDAVDNYGNKLNKSTEYFSLKIRGYKTVRDPETGEMTDAIDDPDLKRRGLADSFMAEHAHFLLNRKKFSIEILCEPAQLAEIPRHWERKYRIGNLTGWINKISSTVSMRNGLEKVTLEMFTL